MANNNESAFSAPMNNIKETVKYKGELRLVGIIKENTYDDTLGYIIMSEKTRQVKAYTVAQAKILFKRFKFVNIQSDSSGNLLCTECSLNRLPVFNERLMLIDNDGIIVLGKITTDLGEVGYRVCNTKWNIVDMSEKDLIALANTKKLVNAKTVSRDGNIIISAILGEFTQISKETVAVAKKKDNSRVAWRKQKHLDKMKRMHCYILYRFCFKNGGVGIPVKAYSTYSEKQVDRHNNKSAYRYYGLDREFSVMTNEIIKDMQVTIRDEKILNNLKLCVPHSKEVKYGALGSHIHYIYKKTYKIKYDTMEIDGTTLESNLLFILATSQFVLYDKECRAKFIKMSLNYIIKRSSYKSFSEMLKQEAIEEFKNSGYMSDILKMTLEEIEKRCSELAKTSIIKEQVITEFKTTKFITEHSIEQLGFTLDDSKDGKQITTECGSKKTLRVLSRYIGHGYAVIKSEARCLGDMLAVGNINKLVKVFKTKDEYGSISEDDAVMICKMIITISYMMGSVSMKKYIEYNNDDIRDTLGFDASIIDFEELACSDFGLSPELKMYYASGFNVFLSDNEYYSYKDEKLSKAKVIDYRSLGIKHNIVHPMLQDELATVLSMVMDDDTESITNQVGQLRFI